MAVDKFAQVVAGHGRVVIEFSVIAFGGHPG
jgi:hypothetical protein